MDGTRYDRGQQGRPAVAPTDVRLSEVLAGLSCALDITEGQRQGHAARSCIIGMRLAGIIGLSAAERSALFYALLMKDLGCSSNAARFAALFAADDRTLKADLTSIDWSHAYQSFEFVARHVAPGQFWLRRVWRLLAVMARGPQGAREVVVTRCERGAEIARLLGFADPTVEAIRALDEHWDGRGQPYALRRHDIPLFGRILNLAQTMEVFATMHGASAAYDVARARRGTWFDPDLVDALFSIPADGSFWRQLATHDTMAEVGLIEPEDRLLHVNEDALDNIAEAFARVVDAKSPWTYDHSQGVARVAGRIAEKLGMPAPALRQFRRAALLHDLGKLGVSSLILDKPGKLTEEEFAAMRRHPEATHQILSRVGCFEPLAGIAAAHHERLDGRGYHRGLVGSDVSLEARILCVADICDALMMSRPYRAGLAPDRVLDILGAQVGAAIDPACFAALKEALAEDAAPRPAVAPEPHIVPALAEDYTQAA
jgi:putative nucleotidyltransferase with HDIG domain